MSGIKDITQQIRNQVRVAEAHGHGRLVEDVERALTLLWMGFERACDEMRVPIAERGPDDDPCKPACLNPQTGACDQCE